jgi:hypothetical protein
VSPVGFAHPLILGETSHQSQTGQIERKPKMIKMNVVFSGCAIEVRIERAIVVETGEEIIIPDSMNHEQVIENIKSGKWAISLAHVLNNARREEVNMSYYKASE